MMSRFTRMGLILALLLGIAACTSKPVMDLEERTAPASVSSEGEVHRAILVALQRRGWSVERADRGIVMAKINLRRHEAEIAIPYTAAGYSIRYRDSRNLDYKNGKIHRNYNRWVINLDRTIQQELSKPLYVPQ